MKELIAFLAAHPGWFMAWAGCLGLVIGSFLNVIILRLPPRLDWGWRQEASEFLGFEPPGEKAPPAFFEGRSHCPRCKHAICWWENIPLASFLALRGKCRGCRQPISWQYPLVEAITGGLFVACAAAWGPGGMFLGSVAFVSLLVAAAVIDFRTTLLPDTLVYPLLWLGLALAAMGVAGAVSPTDAILGALAGYLSLWTVYWGFRLATGKEGMGHGDFKLLAALGAWCGPGAILPIVLLSTFAGIAIGGGALLVQGRDKATPFAFGPFLAIGGLVEFFWRGGLMGALAGSV